MSSAKIQIVRSRNAAVWRGFFSARRATHQFIGVGPEVQGVRLVELQGLRECGLDRAFARRRRRRHVGRALLLGPRGISRSANRHAHCRASFPWPAQAPFPWKDRFSATAQQERHVGALP
jgi:hypothetical protein